MAWFDQSEYAVRFEWGAAGVASLSPSADVVVIVDVLSFSTCVDVAVSRGATVFPYRWKDASAVAFAESVDGVLAGPRSHDAVSLSPVSLRRVARGDTIVLPSPNGATLSGLTGGVPTLTGCLRNAAAVARAAESLGSRIAVIASGERWPDNTLRPCVEDWLGAGAIIAHLTGTTSPEAELARDAFLSHGPRIASVIAASASGRELIEQGWHEDVAVASEVDVSTNAPLLVGGGYRALEVREQL